MSAYRPLAGLRVVECATYVAGPLCGLTLAQLGAQVLRVDPPGGAADTRRMPLSRQGRSMYWQALNRGKESLVLDLTDPQGAAVLRRILDEGGRDGGVFVTNGAPGSATGYDALKDCRPDLIHVQILGTPDARPAVDYTVNAASGFAWLTGPADTASPVNHVLPAWDVQTGLYAALAVMAALRERELTGRGQSIVVSLADVALATTSNLGLLTEAEHLPGERVRDGNHVYGLLARDFRCRGGRTVMVVVLTGRHLARLASVLGLSEAVARLEAELGADFSRERDRYRWRHELVGLLEPWFAEHDPGEVETALAATSLPWAWFRTFEEMLASEARGPNTLLARQRDGELSTWVAGSPIRSSEQGPVRLASAPLLMEGSAP